MFFILLQYIDRLAGMTVLFDTGSGKHRRLINMLEVGEAYTPEYRAALLAMVIRFVPNYAFAVNHETSLKPKP